MIIRKAKPEDAPTIKELYFNYLTRFPPREDQDMALWKEMISRFQQDEKMHLLVAEEEGRVVSTVQMAIVETLTHHVRPFAVIENVVTHPDWRNKGYASALLEEATERRGMKGLCRQGFQTARKAHGKEYRRKAQESSREA